MTDRFRPLKNAFGRFATGVCVATCMRTDGGFRAITINSFTSVSLDPPLVSWCIERGASSFADFMTADHYGVSVLSAGQQAISQRFARHDPLPLAPKEYEQWGGGPPILADRLAGFSCCVVDRHPAGDHVILIAEVARFDVRPGAPLVYFHSGYAALAEKDG
jgi:flavin reductase (DIM6/NTAB) family NADH-FMN oxidoreductase RutF